MPRPFIALLTAALALPSVQGAAPPAGPPMYFPTEVGARWVYRAAAGQEITSVVAAVEERGGAKVVSVAWLMEEGRPVTVQKVSVSARGLFMVWAYGSDCNPVCQLRCPPVPGEKWESQSVVAGMPLRELCEASGPERVVTPAGAFMAVRVESSVRSGFGGPWTKTTAWYAPGVGLVKRASGDQASALVSFTPAGGKAAGEKAAPPVRSPRRSLNLVEAAGPEGRRQAGLLALSTVALGPGGKTLAWGKFDSRVEIREVRTGREVGTLRQVALPPASGLGGGGPATPGPHLDGVLALAFSPDGTTLASGNRDRTVRLWGLRAAREKAVLRVRASFVHFLAFSPDGGTLASGGCQDAAIELWDVRSGRRLAALKGHPKGATAAAFSPDGKTLASSGQDGKVRLWDVASGEERATLDAGTLSVLAVAFSPDGRTLAVGCEDQTVRLWDARTGKERARLKGHTSWVRSLAFSPDGKALASGTEHGPVKLWDAATGECLATLAGHANRVVSLVFGPGGKTLSSAGLDQTVKVWDASPPRP